MLVRCTVIFRQVNVAAACRPAFPDIHPSGRILAPAWHDHYPNETQQRHLVEKIRDYFQLVFAAERYVLQHHSDSNLLCIIAQRSKNPRRANRRFVFPKKTLVVC